MLSVATASANVASIHSGPLDFELLRDINPSNSLDGAPAELTVIGDYAYFVASASGTGRELFRTDGTTLELVADLQAGSASSVPIELTAYQGQLFFRAGADDVGRELFRHDPVTGVTEVVVDINEGFRSSLPLEPAITEFAGQLFFRASDSTPGSGLWKTDGTIGNATRVGDPSVSGDGSVQRELTVAGDTLYFSAQINASTGSPRSLWASDGTTEGTMRLTGEAAANPERLIAQGDRVFYRSDDETADDPGVWLSVAEDGVANRLRQFDDTIVPLAAYDGEFYFTALQLEPGGMGVGQHALWKSDGTIDGTVPIADLPRGGIDGAVVDGLLYFRARVVSESHTAVWRTDGTTAGTFQLTDATRSLTGLPVDAGGVTLFTNEGEPWTTDGTVEGTTELVTIYANSGITSEAADYTPFADGVLFSARDGFRGRELWSTDVTAEGTRLLHDIDALPSDDAFPQQFTTLDGVLYFLARSGANENTRELWRTDGTTERTRRVADIASQLPGRPISNNSVLSITTRDERLLIHVIDGPSGQQLWESDGTEAGTRPIQQPPPPGGGFAFGRPAFFTDAGDLTFFRALSTDDSALWRTDGTAAGTFTVGDAVKGGTLISRGETALDDVLYFFGYTVSTATGTNSGGPTARTRARFR